MIAHLVELTKYDDLILSWTEREIKIRYSQSIMGAAWAILQPLSLMVIFTIVFSTLLKVDTDGVPYPVFAYAALLPWTFFANSLSLAFPSLINNMNLVSKIYFPREILPISVIIASLIDFLIAASVYVVIMLIYHVEIHWTILYVPLLILIQIILTIGITLFASATTVFFRDIRFVVPLGLQLWMYMSPVFYPADIVPAAFRTLYFLNPMAVLIDAYRKAIVYGQAPNWPYLALAAVMSVLLAIGAYIYFKRVERVFADII